MSIYMTNSKILYNIEIHKQKRLDELDYQQ